MLIRMSGNWLNTLTARIPLIMRVRAHPRVSVALRPCGVRSQQ